MTADVDDVERARALGHEVRPCQLRRRLGKRRPRGVRAPAALPAELPGQRGQREDGADPAAAVLVALEPVAHGDGGRRERPVPVGQLLDRRLGQSTLARGGGETAIQQLADWYRRSEEHTSELQSPCNLVCRLLLEKKKNK